MKYFMMVGFLICFMTISKAQIKIIDNYQDKISHNYDSLSNFKKNPKEYIGQTLFLKPLAESSRKYGYDKIYERKNNRIWTGVSIPYSVIAEQSFKVIDVVKLHEDRVHSRECLVLLNFKNDTLYHEFDSYYEHNFPFVVEGYHKKILSKYKNVKYVSRFKNLNDYDTGQIAKDVNGNIIENKVGSIWEIKDIVLDNKYYKLHAVLVNSQGVNYLHGLNEFELNHNFWFVPLSICNKIKIKYGNSLYQTALNRKVKIGMSKDICEFSWGKPSDINKTNNRGVREQWVYDTGSYLYFTDGKLTSIQN